MAHPGPEFVFRDPDAELTEALRSLQHILIKHPIAAQAGFRSLVAEGKSWAETPEGAAWKARLAGSELVARARVTWEGLTNNVLESEGDNVIPSTLIDAVIAAAGHPGLEALLARLHAGGVGNVGPR